MRITIFCDGLTEPKNPNGYGCCAWIAFEGDVSGRRGILRPPCIAFNHDCIARPGEGITNNICEYRAVRAALKWAVKNHADAEVEIRTDSMLVVNQVNGEWGCHAEHLKPFCDECSELLFTLPRARLIWIPREENDVADALTRIAYMKARAA